MKYELVITKSFKKDYKKLNNEETAETDSVIKTLLNGDELAEKFKDHGLQGNYLGYRECHIRPDLLLVYKKDDSNPNEPEKILFLTCLRVNSHTNIFDIKKRKK